MEPVALGFKLGDLFAKAVDRRTDTPQRGFEIHVSGFPGCSLSVKTSLDSVIGGSVLDAR